MKTLFVLRHAKSSWDDPDLADYDRPLNGRGNETAPFMGKVMTRNKFTPALILASPAARARETAVLVRKSAEFKADIKHDERIYEASPQTLLQVVAGIDDAFESAMLVGHNPGMEGFIRLTTGKPESMPTAALAVIDLEIDEWQQIAAGSGTLRKVIRPKDEIKRLRT